MGKRLETSGKYRTIFRLAGVGWGEDGELDLGYVGLAAGGGASAGGGTDGQAEVAAAGEGAGGIPLGAAGSR